MVIKQASKWLFQQQPSLPSFHRQTNPSSLHHRCSIDDVIIVVVVEKCSGRRRYTRCTHPSIHRRASANCRVDALRWTARSIDDSSCSRARYAGWLFECALLSLTPCQYPTGFTWASCFLCFPLSCPFPPPAPFFVYCCGTVLLDLISISRFLSSLARLPLLSEPLSSELSSCLNIITLSIAAAAAGRSKCSKGRMGNLKQQQQQQQQYGHEMPFSMIMIIGKRQSVSQATCSLARSLAAEPTTC